MFKEKKYTANKQEFQFLLAAEKKKKAFQTTLLKCQVLKMCSIVQRWKVQMYIFSASFEHLVCKFLLFVIIMISCLLIE